MSAVIEVKVPDIGDFTEVETIEVLVGVGDSIEVDQALISLESDKATLEVPSTVAGVIKEMKVNIGDRVSKGSVILLAEASDATQAQSEQESQEQTQATKEPPAVTTPETNPPESMPPPAPTRPLADTSSGNKSMVSVQTPSPVIDNEAFKLAYASPSVRKFARELGADLGQLKGSGHKGRITKEDVKGFVKTVMQAGGVVSATPTGGMGIESIPAVDFSQFGEIERKPLLRIKKLTSKHLRRAWLNIPMVTHHDEADITDLEGFRQSIKDEATKASVKVTPLAFMLKACAVMLKKYPTFNASLSPDGEELIYKKYVHIGIAVDTPQGLVVPVIRDVDKKGIFDLAKEMGAIGVKAREGKLSPDDMKGGCFSISSLGSIGGCAFTPLINAPEVAILGAARSKMMPIYNGKEFVPRLMQPLDLTYDHRVIDGAEAARFVKDLAMLLSDFRRISL